ncbi:MAG: Do family serine endopeptidase [Planctomycetota bacterium]|jgi:serine protease Do
MQVDSFKLNTHLSRGRVVATLVLLVFLVLPASVFAEEQESIAALRQMGKAFTSIAEKASPAVVAITAERTATRRYSAPREWPFGDPFENDPFEFFRRRSPRQRSPQQRGPAVAQGSGFLVSADGYIFTNNHLVGEAEKVEVELGDGRKFDAKIIGADEDTDVAVVKIDAEELPYLEFADSDAIEVGEWVLAIGNPLTFSHTVTAGIVSATGRSSLGLATLENFIQTDAAINFGNSGGPLINLDGKVVGMNSAIVGASGNIGIGFAIPINMAKHAYDQFLEGGTVEYGFLGVMPETMSPDDAPIFDLEEGTRGVEITEVTPDSPADKGGVKHNDVILELNGEPVESADTFRNRVARHKPGSRVELLVWRDGKRKTLTVKLGKRPSRAELDGAMPEDTVEELGFAVRTLTDELAQRYGYENQAGVIVSEVVPGSQAARAGIVLGALIKEVNLRQVKNTKEFNEAIKKAKKRGRARLLVKRGVSPMVSITLRLSQE